MTDPVDHPSHYNQHPSGVECIDIVEHMTFNVGNAVKYVWRSGLKDDKTEIEDLRKAAWYLNREIERLSREGDSRYTDQSCPRCKNRILVGQIVHNCCPEHNEWVCGNCRDELHPEGPRPIDPGWKVANGSARVVWPSDHEHDDCIPGGVCVIGPNRICSGTMALGN